jgi:hypothetical protein
MESMDNFRERFEALEQRTAQLQRHTRMVERRLRWWRGIACGAMVLGKPCHHLLYSGGEFVRLYPVNPGQTSNYAAKTKKAAMRAYKSALDI